MRTRNNITSRSNPVNHYADFSNLGTFWINKEAISVEDFIKKYGNDFAYVGERYYMNGYSERKKGWFRSTPYSRKTDVISIFNKEDFKKKLVTGSVESETIQDAKTLYGLSTHMIVYAVLAKVQKLKEGEEPTPPELFCFSFPPACREAWFNFMDKNKKEGITIPDFSFNKKTKVKEYQTGDVQQLVFENAKDVVIAEVADKVDVITLELLDYLGIKEPKKEDGKKDKEAVPNPPANGDVDDDLPF